MADIHRTRIDTLQEINLDTATLSDIRWQYGTGISTATGNKRAGTYKPGYRNGVMTDLGDIQVDVWRQAVEYIVQREGEEWLVDALTDWENAHNYMRKSKKQVHISALSGYASRIFDRPTWVDYIPFNRKYRPDTLRQAQIVTVVNSCCGKPGDVTRQQIDLAYNKKICCPHCGRWSTFSLASNKDVPPWEEHFIGREMIG